MVAAEAAVLRVLRCATHPENGRVARKPVERMALRSLRSLRTKRSTGRFCLDNRIALRYIHYQGKIACQLGR